MDKSITTEAVSCWLVRSVQPMHLAMAVAKTRSVLVDYPAAGSTACLLDERLVERSTMRRNPRASDRAHIMEAIQ